MLHNKSHATRNTNNRITTNLMKNVKKYGWIPLVLITIFLAAFIIWASETPNPAPQAIAALNSTEHVVVDQSGDWLIFEPTGKNNGIGVVFYPGGKVDARSYAPLAQDIAHDGYTVVLVPMPLNLAVFAPNRAAEVMEQFPSIEKWAIAGHSLGGSMAANFADGHPDQVDGIVFWASYPAQGDMLADQSIAVTSIYGTEDGLATVEDIENSRPLLPSDTIWVPIKGGNHAQFGWYGPQSGDNPATISPEEQQAQIVNATIALLERIGNTP